MAKQDEDNQSSTPEQNKPTRKDVADLAYEIDQLYANIQSTIYPWEEPDREVGAEKFLWEIANGGIDNVISGMEGLAQDAAPDELPRVQELLEKLRFLAQIEIPPIQRPDGNQECLWLLESGEYLHIYAKEYGFDYTLYDRTHLSINNEGSIYRPLLSMADACKEICYGSIPNKNPIQMLPTEMIKVIQNVQPDIRAGGNDTGRRTRIFAAQFALYAANRKNQEPIDTLPPVKIGEIQEWVLSHLKRCDYRPLSDVLLDIMEKQGQNSDFDHLTDTLSEINMAYSWPAEMSAEDDFRMNDSAINNSKQPAFVDLEEKQSILKQLRTTQKAPVQGKPKKTTEKEI